MEAADVRQTISPANKIKREFERHKTMNEKMQKQIDQETTKESRLVRRDKSDVRVSEDEETKSNKEVKTPANKPAVRPSMGKDAKVSKARKPKLIANVHYTKYPIVRSILRKEYKMRLYEDDFEDFDILWCDHVLANDRIMRMKPY